MTNLTELLAETKAIVEAATPAPWQLQDDEIRHYAGSTADLDKEYISTLICDRPLDDNHPDLEFIAHARTMMPALIEALELSMKQTDDLAGCLNWAASPNDKKKRHAELADILRKAGDR